MNSIREISVDMDLLTVKANTLRALTDRASQCIARLNTLSEDMTAIWRGEAADALCAELREEAVMAERAVRQLELTRIDLDTAIGVYRESEDNIALIMRALNDGGM